MITKLKTINHTDHRGTLVKSFNGSNVCKGFLGAKDGYVATSFQNIFRGLHRQSGAFAQAKLFTVIRGRILLFAIDSEQLTRQAPIAQAIELSNKRTDMQACIVSRNSFTGYLALGEENIVSCIADAEYSPDREECISPKSLILADTKLDFSKIILSEKDIAASTYAISGIELYQER